MSRWTQEQYDAIMAKRGQTKGNINTGEPVVPRHMIPDPPPPTPQPRREAKQLAEMKGWLRVLKIPFEEEYRFHDVRKFRFDIAIVEHKIAVEYEGIISEKSRHTTVAGYTEDSNKYNLAQLCGWRVLRYTVKNYNKLVSDLLLALRS